MGYCTPYCASAFVVALAGSPPRYRRCALHRMLTIHPAGELDQLVLHVDDLVEPGPKTDRLHPLCPASSAASSAPMQHGITVRVQRKSQNEIARSGASSSKPCNAKTTYGPERVSRLAVVHGQLAYGVPEAVFPTSQSTSIPLRHRRLGRCWSWRWLW